MTPYYRDDHVTIYHGDCREWMPEADVVITDPPYGTGGRRRVAGRKTPIKTVREEWDNGSTEWLRAVPSAVPVITFWPASSVYGLLTAARATGRDGVRLLMWRKPNPLPVQPNFVQLSVEPAWCLYSGRQPISGGPDFIERSSMRAWYAEAEGHPYQKPLEVMSWLVGLSTGVVLDPFAGSGSTLVAAKGLGRSAIGVELDERYCEIAARRCSQEVLGLDAA